MVYRATIGHWSPSGTAPFEYSQESEDFAPDFFEEFKLAVALHQDPWKNML